MYREHLRLDICEGGLVAYLPFDLACYATHHHSAQGSISRGLEEAHRFLLLVGALYRLPDSQEDAQVSRRFQVHMIKGMEQMHLAVVGELDHIRDRVSLLLVLRAHQGRRVLRHESVLLRLQDFRHRLIEFCISEGLFQVGWLLEESVFRCEVRLFLHAG